MQLLWLGALPLALAGVHCLALGRHQRKAMIGLALAVVLAWGSCVYYAVLLTPLIMVVIFLYATSGLVSNRLSFLIRAASSLFLGLALMSQELWAYSRISTNFGFLRKIYLFPSSPLWRYVHLEPDRWVFWGNALAHTPAEGEKVLFPGVILLGLVAASLIFLTALFFRRAAAWIRVLARERGKGVSLHPGSKILWPSLLILVGILGVRMFVLDHDVSLLLLAVLLACLKPGPNDASNPPAVAARALFLVALAGFVLSLGLTLEVSKTTYTLPLTWLYDFLPGFNAVRFPSRWGIFAIAGMTGLVAILGAIMVEQRRRLRFGLPLVLTAFALVELWPHNFELIRIPDLIEDRPANRFLHDHPGGVLAVLPVRTGANRFTDGVCLDAVITYAAACFYHHPVLNGMSGFDPPFYEKVVMPALEAFPRIESRQLLDALGVRWLYVQGQFYEKSRFDDLVAFVGAHPENFRLAFRQDLDLVLERVGKTDMNPEDLPDNAATKMKQLSDDCTVSTAIASAEASFLVDEKVETIWSTKGPQIGHESIAVSCRQPMTIAGFVFELGGRYADYPRGLVIEYKSKDGHWVPLLVEKKCAGPGPSGFSSKNRPGGKNIRPDGGGHLADQTDRLECKKPLVYCRARHCARLPWAKKITPHGGGHWMIRGTWTWS